MAETYSEPFADSSQIPTYLLSEFSKKKITVALSGDGGDEIFGGYNRYIYFQKYKILLKYIFLFNKINLLDNNLTSKFLNYVKSLSSFRESSYKIESIKNLKNISEYYKKMIMQSSEVSKLFKNKAKYNIHYLKGIDNENPLKMMQIKDLNNYLPDDIITKVDRASMANSLEVRCPL